MFCRPKTEPKVRNNVGVSRDIHQCQFKGPGGVGKTRRASLAAGAKSPTFKDAYPSFLLVNQ